MHKKRSELYFVYILISIDKINRNIKNISYQEFIEDELAFGLITRSLQEIGENVNKILKICDLGDKAAKWQKIVDFRNVIVHKYFSGLCRDQAAPPSRHLCPQRTVSTIARAYI